MGNVRLEFVADLGAKRGQTFSGVVVEPEYEAIMKAILNKLKMKRKDNMLLVLRDKYQGTQLLSAEKDISGLLRDGATVVLTMQRPCFRIPPPPRWPWPTTTTAAATEALAADSDDVDADKSDEEPQVVAESGRDVAVSSPAVASSAIAAESAAVDTDRKGGPWPLLDGNVLSLVRRAIKGESNFVEKEFEGYIAFDYHASNASQLPSMFPDPRALPKKSDSRLLVAVRRECRGLLVCSHSGVVLARRFPKFFNVDELEETQLDRLPAGGMATKKIDGSLMSPFMLAGEVRWAGKSSIVPAVETFAKGSAVDVVVADVLRQGCTPIFEWCEVGPPVGVISHSHQRLVLLTVRENGTGNFWPHSHVRMLGCDCVDAVPFETLQDLHLQTRADSGQEGVVISWPEQGLIVKVKSAWWIALAAAQTRGSGKPALALAHTLKSLSLSSLPPALVWQAIISGEDDQMALVYGQLAAAAHGALRKFAASVEKGIRTLGDELKDWAERAAEASEADLAGIAGGWPPAVLAAYQRRSPSAERDLRKFLAKLAASGQVLATEALCGTTWDGGKQPVEVLVHLGEFERAPDDIVEHVLDTYLPRKLEDYLGCPMSDDTPVRVERLYEPSEGKFKGLWERFADQGIIDLRVDLQPRAKVYDFHSGDADFAHWQVQFGPNDNCPRSTKAKEGDRKGAFAGVLLRTGIDVDFAQLRDALKLSFSTQKVVRLDPSPSSIFQVYLDLDGVVVDFEAGFQKDFGGLPEPKLRWQHIENTPGFYEDLPWMQDARRLWEHVSQMGLPLFILTGIPEGPFGERSAAEKVKWVARELGPDVQVITCLTREKPRYSGPGRLLIDDRPQPGWEAMGGRQIRHTSVSETLSSLTELGLGRHFSATREKVLLLSGLEDDLRLAAAQAAAVALDAEWQPDRAGAPPSPAAVLQLSFRPSGRWSAFVIDTLAWDQELRDFVTDLLASDLPKLVFGPGDAQRLNMRIASATDLQEGTESLAAQARKAGLLLNKAKALQASDWAARPLRDEQLVYAATDALVLLELAAHFGDGRVATQICKTQEVGRAATVEYTGVFLTPEARQKLLRRVPPRFSEVAAEHLTLAWKPECVKGLAVGSMVRLQVEGVACKDGVQAVSVVTLEAQPRRGHVTICHRSDIPAVDANCVDFEPMDVPFTIEGVVGASVLLGGVDSNQLPASILNRLRALAQGQPGQSEKIEDLTDSLRYAVHLAADELGLEHRSEGKKGTMYRKLIVMQPKGRKAHQVVLKASQAQSAERVVIKEPRKFAALFGDVPGLTLHGRMTQDGVAWEPGVKLPPTFENILSGSATRDGDTQVVVIMRGFPGSGKSSLACQLRKLGAMEVASADDFFTTSGEIQVAHEQCRQAFLQALSARRSVIVDNTNIRRSDYAFYRSKAEELGCAVVVLEFVCDSTAALERLRERSVHGVPGGAMGAMWTRWEQDSTALRIAPFLPLKLMHWVREQNMINRPPNTHLVMPKGPFFSVPVSARPDFHERFSRELGSHYISEQARPQAFRLFFDIDGLEFKILLPALGLLRELVGAELVVTGTEEAPAPGYHIFVPSRTVDAATAAELRERWIELVPSLAKHVDGQLYKVPQLRLLGSRKISKEGVDMGRVHRFVGRFGSEWQEDASWEWFEVSIIV